MRGREQSLWRRVVRRFKSSRASVYLEYAVVLPLVVLSISALIEFVAFWDAKIMANHTAWTCARIASVEAGEKDWPEEGVKGLSTNRLRTKGMKTATAMLMSTCAMGSMQGSAKDFVSNWYEKLVTEPLAEFENKIVKHVNDFGGNVGTKLDGLNFGGFDKIKNVVQNANQSLVGGLKDLIVKDLLKPLFKRVNKAIDGFFKPILKKVEDALNGNRTLRQIAYATGRVAADDGIITVRERGDMAFAYGKTTIDFPRCLDNSAKCDEWFVQTDSPWPPNGQQQRMIDVTIRWPFERAWLFPVLSTAKGAKVDSGIPTAVGRALFYPQPAIKNEHLKSEDAEAFASATTNNTSEIDKAKNKYMGFIQVAALYYHYQLGNEEVGPYDSDKNRGGTYKGIGLGISGETDMEKIGQDDGLVFWSGRAPDNPRDQSAWKSKSPPADYLKCFQSITGEKNENCGFWTKVKKKFHKKKTVKTSALKSFENHAYWKKEWFYWGDGNDALKNRLRLKHSETLNSEYLTKDIGVCVAWLNELVIKWASDPKSYVSEIKLCETNSAAFRSIACAKAVRQAFLVKYRIGRNVSENEYWANSVTNAPYESYKALVAQEPRLAPSVANMILARSDDSLHRSTTNTLYQECERLDLEAERILFDEVPKLHNATCWMMKLCSDELDKALAANKKESENKENSKDEVQSENFFDLGGLGGNGKEELNATNAAKVVEEKLKILKPKVFEAVAKIDACEKKLRDFSGMYGVFNRRLSDLIDRRDRDVVEFARLVGLSILESGGAGDPDLVLANLRERHPWSKGSRDPYGESLSFWTLADETRKLFQDYYDAQVELGNLFNLKGAKLSLNQLADGQVPGLDGLGKPIDDPTLPSASSAESGSDNDGTGDSWTYDSKEGWKSP